MIKQLSDLIDPAEVQAFRMFLYELWQQENKYLLKNDLILQFEKFCKENQRSDLLEPGASIEKLLRHTPELNFIHDQSINYSVEIEERLKEIYDEQKEN